MPCVRDAVSQDLPAVTAICNALLDTTTYEWSENRHTVAERELWLANQAAIGCPALVAVEGEAVVGYASYGDFRDSSRWPGYRFTVEHSIHVREDRWGRGIGRMLVESLLDCARREGRHVMVAAIDGSNTRSIRFHDCLGFVEVARMPEIGEKFGRRLDLVLMQRVVDEPSRVIRGWSSMWVASCVRSIPHADSTRCHTKRDLGRIRSKRPSGRRGSRIKPRLAPCLRPTSSARWSTRSTGESTQSR